MAAYEVLLLNTAVPQIQAAQSGDTYVVPRDIAFSAALTLSAGTANGVPYLNASKVLTTGSALTFDGTSLGVGFTANSRGGVVMTTTNNSGASEQGGYAVTNGNGTGLFAGVNGASYSTGGIGNANNAVLYTIGNTDLVFGRNTSEQMRLTSTGLGIGTSSPAYKLHIGAAGNAFSFGSTTSSTAYNAGLINNAGGSLYFGVDNSAGTAFNGVAYAGVIGTSNATPFQIFTNNVTRATLDTSGNLGLGVTPSAWGGAFRALQFEGGSGVHANTVAQDFNVINQAYNNGSGYVYQNSSQPVARYQQYQGTHAWFTAPSGTAGNAISFSQVMTLDASGNLVVGTTGTAQGRVHAHATTNAQFVATDATLGTTYGGVFRGYGVVGQGGNAELGVLDNGSYTKAIKILDNATGIQFFTGVTNAGSTERARITSVGNFKIGGTADRATTEGTNQLVLFNGTAPVGTLTNGVSFYSESGEARVMDAAGNSTLLSPHDTATNEWIFHSKHTPTGKVLRIDVERLLKFVNDHFGLDAVHEFIEE